MRFGPAVRSHIRILVGASIVAMALSLSAAGCGVDDVGPRSRMVGGRCTVAGDCVNRCVTGADFPGGYCSVVCANHADCPGGSVCVAAAGGVCLAACRVPADCHDFGPEYACSQRTSQSGGPGVLACAAN